jgi:hypothetical protein
MAQVVAVRPSTVHVKDANGKVIMPVYTMEEVARHKSKDDGWMVVEVQRIPWSSRSSLALALVALAPVPPRIPLSIFFVSMSLRRAGSSTCRRCGASIPAATRS